MFLPLGVIKKLFKLEEGEECIWKWILKNIPIGWNEKLVNPNP
jgi:hypothetical protein